MKFEKFPAIQIHIAKPQGCPQTKNIFLKIAPAAFFYMRGFI